MRMKTRNSNMKKEEGSPTVKITSLVVVVRKKMTMKMLNKKWPTLRSERSFLEGMM
jgi:hypothetical protein